jgi:hypothetical protein
LADYFDGWYADMTGSPAKDEIQQRCLGLPPHLLSTSLLGWDGIAEATAASQLSPGQTLVDLACGRGGYGLEVAARTGARLVGADFSAAAVRQAREHAGTLGAAAEFRGGNLTGTGLEDGPLSVPCGKKPPRTTPVMTLRRAHSTTRACAPCPPSAWSAGSSPPRPHQKPAAGTPVSVVLGRVR